MSNAIAGFLVPLLRLAFPARGRHRSAGPLAVTRRDHRIDAGPRWIHAVEAAA